MRACACTSSTPVAMSCVLNSPLRLLSFAISTCKRNDIVVTVACAFSAFCFAITRADLASSSSCCAATSFASRLRLFSAVVRLLTMISASATSTSAACNSSFSRDAATQDFACHDDVTAIENARRAFARSASPAASFEASHALKSLSRSVLSAHSCSAAPSTATYQSLTTAYCFVTNRVRFCCHNNNGSQESQRCASVPCVVTSQLSSILSDGMFADQPNRSFPPALVTSPVRSPLVEKPAILDHSSTSWFAVILEVSGGLRNLSSA
mmetsp:Transcript_87484/g.245635  ORF Transcript_87484/g.245635 Transcript_87484/m.245635 type:complete len:267 (+) Transcript_87484:868-1668(+)